MTGIENCTIVSRPIKGSIIICKFFLCLAIGNINAQNNERNKFGTTHPDSPILNEEHTTFLRGNGILFAPNKGQIVDMNGKLCPNVLYKGNSTNSDIYLRNTGISYVFTDINEIMHGIDEELETLEKSGKITEASEDEKKRELMENRILKIQRVDMDFTGCNKHVITTSEDELEGYNNYYYAHCPQGITNVKRYNKITFKNIYNNIDVNYHGNKETGVKYDIVINPHGNPDQIKLKWTGAKHVNISRTGDLVIQTNLNEFSESIPKVYQNINGHIVDIVAKYIILNDTLSVHTDVPGSDVVTTKSYTIGFSIEKYNSDYPLIIDPWITYYGGSLLDQGISVNTDPSGNVICTGQTQSLNFPVTTGASQSSLSALYDAFIFKMSPAGNPVFSTYFGGSDYDGGFGIAADITVGNICVVGYTGSLNLPVGVATGNTLHQSLKGGGKDAFLARFDISGIRIWATYYGGTSDDFGNDVSVDGSGNVYLYGDTYSTNTANVIATPAAFQIALKGMHDVFVVKFTPIGSRTWGSYVGGTSDETCGGIDCDVSDNIYIGGTTTSTNFPVFMAHQSVSGGSAGAKDAFLFKFSSAGTRIWATYYGGGLEDEGFAVTTDGLGNVILGGSTLSTTAIATAGAFQPVYNGGPPIFWGDGFIVKFNSSGVRQWGTYLGGSTGTVNAGMEELNGLDCDASNNIIAAGDTYSTNFPVTTCAFQTGFKGSEDQFITTFKPDGNLICSSYLGKGASNSPNNETAEHRGGCVAVYGCNIYLTAYSSCTYPVTTGSFQTTCTGTASDAVIVQLNKLTCGLPKTLASFSSATTICAGQLVNFDLDNNSCDSTNVTYLWNFNGGTPSTSNSRDPMGISWPVPGTYTVSVKIMSACDTGIVTIPNYITVNACGITALATEATICSGNCATITSNAAGGTSPYTYSWNTGATTQNISLCPSTTTTYTVKITDAGGFSSTSTATITINPAVTVNATPTNINCNGDQNGSAMANAGSGTPGYIYTWSNAQTTQTITGLIEGNYTVTVSDKNGCSATATTTITSPLPLVGEFIKGTSNCSSCGCKEWIMVNATGGISPYSYVWPGGYNKRYQNQLCPGTYTINVQDKNGCNININLSVP